MVDTAGTLCSAAAALKKRAPVAWWRIACTRAVRACGGQHRQSELDEIVVTDTIPLSEAAQACGKIRQLSVAQMLAETIRRMAQGESVSSMYVD
jgi:ribose-phosphate pyrophosphokinase